MIIERISPNGLGRRAWSFTVVNEQLRLAYYYEQSRSTKRHKFKTAGKWSAYSKRDSTIPLPATPYDVIAEALTEARSRISFIEPEEPEEHVIKWSLNG